MSTDSSDSSDPNPYRGPRITREHRVVNASLSPTVGGSSDSWSGWRSHAGQQFEGDRQLFDVLGYEAELDIENHVAMYKRGPGIARGIVDKIVHDCWDPDLEVVESDDTDVDETAFERQVKQFLDGEFTRLSPIARLRAADRWARLLEFSVLVIGINDGNVVDGDPSSLSEPVDEASIDSLDQINYISPFDQRSVDWERTTLVDDPTDPRYQLPETYNIDFGDTGSHDVHHSRVIHVVENPDENELKSDEIYRPIFNRLQDLQKVLGGSAEMFWRAAYPGLVLQPPTDADGVPMRFEDGGDGIAEQIKQYRHNISRVHKVTGSLEKLDTTVASPVDQVAVAVEDISAHIDIPMSMIRGNETGERATSEDRAMYHETAAGRRDQHCVPQLLSPLLERLIEWGLLPETESGNGTSFSVEWPPLETESEADEAEVASTWANAIETISGGRPGTIASVEERRKRIGFDPEFGSDAPTGRDAEDLAAERLEVPADADTPANVPGPDGGDGDADDGDADSDGSE